MKSVRWTIVVVAIAALFLAAAVPPVDISETAFDECDTPINQTTPVVMRTVFIVPTVQVDIIPFPLPLAQKHSAMSHAPMEGIRGGSHSLLNLLCMLVC
jgi:hypothetical protein